MTADLAVAPDPGTAPDPEAPKTRLRTSRWFLTGLALILVSLTALVPATLHNWHEMRAIPQGRSLRLHLDKGTYWIYQDMSNPGANDVPATGFPVSGPSGPVPVHTTSHELRPFDIVEPLRIDDALAAFPVAEFHIDPAGTYVVGNRPTLGPAPPDSYATIWVGGTYGDALRLAGVPLAALLIGLLTVVLSAIQVFRAPNRRSG